MDSNMKHLLNALILCALLTVQYSARAAGYTAWATPTQLEFVNNGLLINGNYGNQNNCGVADKVFVSKDTVGIDKFNNILSVVMLAYTSGQEMRFYNHGCFQVTFHGINVNESSTAIYIRPNQ